MKEKPIIFSTPMVQAILKGRKTMTRRVIKPQPEINTRYEIAVIEDEKLKICGRGIGDIWETRRIYKMPYHVGDILWVRETWALISDDVLGHRQKYYYRADDNGGLRNDEHWRPSIHMPRAAARLFLEVKSVRVKRLRYISYEDAEAEGIIPDDCMHCGGCDGHGCYDPITPFKKLWDSLNAKRGYSWEDNPWVWVIEFERVEYEKQKL